MIDIKNKSVTYIVPLVLTGINLPKKAIINSFLYHVDYIDYNQNEINGVFVLFSYNYMGKADLRHEQNCEFIIDIDSNHFMAYIKIKSQDIKDDVDLLIKGKFSKVSFYSKVIIKDFWQFKDNTQVIHILNKNTDYKIKLEEQLDVKLPEDAELGSIFDISKEVFSNKLLKVKLEV